MFSQSKAKYIFVFSGVLTLFASLCIVSSKGQSSGGNFNVQKSVVAGGGTSSTGNGFTLTGTVGQSIAGTNSQNTSFSLQSGFWTPDFAPTAAEAILGGRVANIKGDGVGKVQITLVDVFTGETRVTHTDVMGNYLFTNVMAGAFYVITAEREKYSFIPPQQTINLSGDETELNFTAVQH